MLIWEGRTLSYDGRNVVVLEKLGRRALGGGFVLVEAVNKPYMRMMVHRSRLQRRIPAERKGNKR